VILRRALSADQLRQALGHIEGGTRVNCGQTSDWWVHSRGYAIEVLATSTTLPGQDSAILEIWQAAFLRLCRAGRILVADHAPRDRERFGKPMTEYTHLLRRANQTDVVLAIREALG